MGLIAGLAALLLLAAAAAPQLILGVAGAASADTVTRSLPDGAMCGDTIQVTLTIDPAEGTGAWLVDEVPPDSVTVSDVDTSHHGTLEDGHVKWVSTTGDAATVTYNVTIPEDTPDGTQLSFDGTYRFDSMSSRADVGGDDVLNVTCGSIARTLPSQATCGDTAEVTLTVDAPAGSEAWLIDEVPPEGLTVSNVETSFSGQHVDGHVKWVSSTGGDATVTYDVAVPAQAAHGAVLVFDGTHRLFPSMDERGEITGDDTVTVTCPDSAGQQVHLFDANADCQFSESELFSLIDQWKQTPASQTPTDGLLFDGIAHWKLLPQPYCTIGG